MAISKKENRSRYIILGILSIRPDSSGYDIKQTIRNSTAFFWDESFGQIYPALAQMKEEGLVKSQEAGNNRQKVIYSITAKGSKVLREWLSQPYIPVKIRNEILLKVFFSNFADEGAMEKHLNQAISEAETFASILAKNRATLKESIVDPLQRFPYEAILDYGILDNETFIQWSKNELDKLEKLKKKRK